MSRSEMRVRRVPMSKWNLGSCAVIVVLMLAAAIRQVWPVVVVMSLGLVVCIIVALAARVGATGDFERVSALEFKDERDRSIAVRSLAVVGGVSLSAPFLFLSVYAIVDYTEFYNSGLTMPIVLYYVFLTVVWSASNWYFARR
ncbi:hypothetical protein ACIRON_19645 [Nocardioides sp. NPDC101246]|uniref:hypothetical protein n=1 Tax=Nocardioides sp. NPDC101246 TaxID=3364336 RepID=UPI00380468F5